MVVNLNAASILAYRGGWFNLEPYIMLRLLVNMPVATVPPGICSSLGLVILNSVKLRNHIIKEALGEFFLGGVHAG